MADYQLPVDYAVLNSSYQDNTTNSITARHGRQLVANAAPWFFTCRFSTIDGTQVSMAPGSSSLITKQWIDDHGHNTGWFVNGFLVKQSENSFLIENVTGANILCMTSIYMLATSFASPDHNFYFALLQQEVGQPLAGFAGSNVTEVSQNSTGGYFFTTQDVLIRRFKKDAKLQLYLGHTSGTDTNSFDMMFRVVIQGLGGWRGYSARYDENQSNADRGRDIGGVKYE